MALILASASPRRQELLRNAGIEFTAHPANVPEGIFPGELPETYVRRLALEKARKIFEQHSADRIIGADTIVVVDDSILGKHVDDNDAARMLRLLSGRKHRVITGVCLITPSVTSGLPALEDIRHETTRVTMQALTEEDILAYVAHGEPMDKAGAYAIQGLASRWIPKIEGCYFNVVGLPVPLVHAMLVAAAG